MTKTKERSDEDEIGDIMRKRIMDAWHKGMTPREIADDTGVSVGVVYRCLKHGQKPFVRQGG
jgi:hypothetical protein